MNIKEVYEVLLRYKNLFGEVFGSIVEYFILMEEGKKPATEIEIHVHCSTPIEIVITRIALCPIIGCENCGDAIQDTLARIRQFKEELKRFGYYVELSQNYDMYISKNKELVQILASVMSRPEPVYHHTVIRGLAFGYSPESILSYMDRTGEIETDWDTANRVAEIVDKMMNDESYVYGGNIAPRK